MILLKILIVLYLSINIFMAGMIYEQDVYWEEGGLSIWKLLAIIIYGIPVFLIPDLVTYYKEVYTRWRRDKKITKDYRRAKDKLK